jgi:hypothetical protein
MRRQFILVASVFAIFTIAACGSDDSGGAADPLAIGNPDKDPGSDLPRQDGAPAGEELTENFGVFVATSGAPNAEGTRAQPLASIQAGLERAKATGKRLYVCSGTYKESVTFQNGTSMTGGFDCVGTAWTRSGARSKIESPTSPALRAIDIATPTRVEGFEVTAPDGTPQNPSSIVLIAERAGGLQFFNTRLIAGVGALGADGVEGIQLTLGAAARGKDATGWERDTSFYPRNPGAAGGTGACVGAPGHNGGSGGQGGSGGVYECQQATAQSFALEWYRECEVGPGGGCIFHEYPRSDAPTVSGAGAGGSGGQNAKSAAPIGTLSPAGYVPADGAKGADGQPGKGGRGQDGESNNVGSACKPEEDGQYFRGFSGAGGGAGGCPGLAGNPGLGGGASIAVMMFASDGMLFERSDLIAGQGGNGGRGTFGSLPTLGGLAGAPHPYSAAAQQPGGRGGLAGISTSGAGGPSFAIAHTGGAPKLENGTTTTVGAGGAGVPEQSKSGFQTKIPASPAGLSKELFAF